MRSVISGKPQASLLAVGACIVCGCYAGDAQTSVVNGKAPINVIFDTDMWADIDDAMALAMLHALHDRREINLVAVTISTEYRWSASYVDLVNTFYGHPDTPVGMVRSGIGAAAFAQKLPVETAYPYTQFLSERRQADDSWVYPHRLTDGTKAPEAVALLRKTLAAQSDSSVVMIQVGFSTNLARLLGSGPDAISALAGQDLIRRKVRLLSVMAGNFSHPKGPPDFNVVTDVPSAQKLFSDWPTPIAVSGSELGIAVRFPPHSIEHDYAYVAHHPIADTYRFFWQHARKKWPAIHPTHDLHAVLYAARPDRQYYSLSKPGRVTVVADGGTRFEESEHGAHRYLIVSEEQKARALEAMVILTSQPPVHHRQP